MRVKPGTSSEEVVEQGPDEIGERPGERAEKLDDLTAKPLDEGEGKADEDQSEGEGKQEEGSPRQGGSG